jgi:hypothetical protein
MIICYRNGLDRRRGKRKSRNSIDDFVSRKRRDFPRIHKTKRGLLKSFLSEKYD